MNKKFLSLLKKGFLIISALTLAISCCSTNAAELKQASPTTSKLYVNNSEQNIQGYNIDFNNYFKLRDLAALLGFNVEWDEENNSIYISTGSGVNTIDNSSNSGSNDPAAHKDEIENFEQINQVVYLVNQERAKYGLPNLAWDYNLTLASIKRSGEIIDVFDHYRPDGTECFTVFDEYNVDYMAAGENIAIGQRTPESVVDGWMNSPGHRANILSGDFGKIGVGAVRVKQDGYNGFAWVQLFTD